MKARSTGPSSTAASAPRGCGHVLATYLKFAEVFFGQTRAAGSVLSRASRLSNAFPRVRGVAGPGQAARRVHHADGENSSTSITA